MSRHNVSREYGKTEEETKRMKKERSEGRRTERPWKDEKEKKIEREIF